MGVALLVGTYKGLAVLTSDDRREDWSFEGLQLNGWQCTASARDSAGRTYVAVTNYPFGSAVVVSDDLRNWKQLDAAPRYAPDDRGNPEHNRTIGGSDPLGEYKGDGRFVDQIWKLHVQGDTIYAGVSEAGLFTSSNGGETWEVNQALNEHPTRPDWEPGAASLCAHSVLVDENDPDRIWVGISAAGVFRSDDGGASWASKNDGVLSDGGAFCIHCLAHEPTNADVIYRQDHLGMYLTGNGGDTWERIEEGLPLATMEDGSLCTFGFPVVFDPGSNAAFILPMEGPSVRYAPDGKLIVYRTQDQGASWQALSSGLPDKCWSDVLRGAMAVDGLDPCGVYFGTTEGKAWASNDLGESWRELPLGLPRITSVEAFQT